MNGMSKMMQLYLCIKSKSKEKKNKCRVPQEGAQIMQAAPEPAINQTEIFNSL